MPDTSVFPCMPLVPLKLLPWCWSSERVSLSMWVHVCGFFKRNCFGLWQFLLLTQSLLVFAARSCGTCLPGTGSLGWGARCGVGAPHSQDIPPEFLSTTHGCRTRPFHVCTPSTSLDGCGFFNSVVVRLPFNLIYDGSRWWLFNILVVTLMWLYKEMSYVCLCHHLDQKSPRNS